ncbi:MAG: Ig-like domain-containing protein, partial [Tateyamaria sp.]
SDQNEEDEIVVTAVIIDNVRIPISEVAIDLGGGRSLLVDPVGDFTFDTGTFYDDLPLGDITTFSFSYELSDGNGGAGMAEVTLSINGTFEEADNQAPIARDDNFGVDEDTPTTIDFLANDMDPDEDRLTVEILDGPDNGEIEETSEGWVFTPDENFNGDDEFTYEISDGDLTDTATVSITVNPINDAPEAVDDEGSADEGSSVTVDVLANDSDVDGDDISIESVEGTLAAEFGSVQIVDGQLVYTADDENFNGTDRFSYTITDGDLTAQAFVDIAIIAVNDAPDVTPGSDETDEDTPLDGSVAGNASDVDGDDLTFALDEGPESGSVDLSPNGSFTYTPAQDFFGDGQFTYTVDDGNGGVTGGLFQITVNPVNDAPELGETGPFSVDENETAVGTITASDVDNDVTELAFAIIGGADGDLFEIDADTGALSFKSAPDFEAMGSADGDNDYEVEVSVSDGDKSDTALVAVTVEDVDEGTGVT